VAGAMTGQMGLRQPGGPCLPQLRVGSKGGPKLTAGATQGQRLGRWRAPMAKQQGRLLAKVLGRPAPHKPASRVQVDGSAQDWGAKQTQQRLPQAPAGGGQVELTRLQRDGLASTTQTQTAARPASAWRSRAAHGPDGPASLHLQAADRVGA